MASAARWADVFWSGHLHYAPLVLGCADATGGTAIVNIYGLEVWANKSALNAQALSRCFVVSDCHATLEHAVGAGIADPARATVIWDPVDLDEFHPADPDPADPDPADPERA